MFYAARKQTRARCQADGRKEKCVFLYPAFTRIIVRCAIVLAFLLIRAELAVGIFGTPFAGSWEEILSSAGFPQMTPDESSIVTFRNRFKVREFRSLAVRASGGHKHMLAAY